MKATEPRSTIRSLRQETANKRFFFKALVSFAEVVIDPSRLNAIQKAVVKIYTVPEMGAYAAEREFAIRLRIQMIIKPCDQINSLFERLNIIVNEAPR